MRTQTVLGPLGPACPCSASASTARRRIGSAIRPAHVELHGQRRLRAVQQAAQLPAAPAMAPCRQPGRRAAPEAARVASHDSASTSQSWAPLAGPRRQQQQQQQQQHRQQQQRKQVAEEPHLLPRRVLPRSRGAWCLRQYEPKDFQQIVELQTTSFHEPFGLGPLAVLDVLARSSFNAEVLDALKKKVAALQSSMFAMLVVEEQGPGGNSSVVGVVEVGLQDQAEVLRHLPRSQSGDKPNCYAHVASMAVSQKHRRQGVASLLLEAAEQQAALWGQQVLALHVHADNAAAVQLYNRCGMRTLYSDPGWRTWVGGRVRLLMAKPVEAAAGGSAGAARAQQ